MDPDFRGILSGAGMGDGTMSVLAEECVLTMDVFLCLREEHFEKLLPKLTVGDHVFVAAVGDQGPGITLGPPD